MAPAVICTAGVRAAGRDARHQARTEQKRLVPHCDQSLTSCDQRLVGRSGLPEWHDCQQADDYDRDDGSLEEPRDDEAEGERFVLPPAHGGQGDGGANTSAALTRWSRQPPDHSGVRTGTDDVAAVAEHRRNQEDCRIDLANGEVEDSGDQRDLSIRGHRPTVAGERPAQWSRGFPPSLEAGLWSG